MAVVGLILLFSEKLEFRNEAISSDNVGITGSFFHSPKQDCSTSITRPCYQRLEPGKVVALSSKAGVKTYQECWENKHFFVRGEYKTDTTYCTGQNPEYDENVIYCSIGKNQYITKFEGFCVRKPGNIGIYSINPNSGPVGTQVTLIGQGFTPTNNYIYIYNYLGGLTFIPTPFSSQDGKTLTFNFPSQTVRNFCLPDYIVSNVFCYNLSQENMNILPGGYHIGIINTFGNAYAPINDVNFGDVFMVT